MWIARLTQTVTALAFVTTVAMVAAFLLANRGLALTFFMGTIGGYLFPIPFALVIATYLLRYSAGMMMVRRGHLDAALEYCLPRRATTLTVGRNEAALNRVAAAEAHRLQNAPDQALLILEETHKKPWRQDVSQLLAAARAQSLFDLDRAAEAKAVLDALAQTRIARSAREAVNAAQARLNTP